MSNYSEAPVSFNVKATSAEGFDVMLTIRDTHPTELMPRALKALDWLKAAGFSPNGRRPDPAAPAQLAPSPSAAGAANTAPLLPNGGTVVQGAVRTEGQTTGAAIINRLLIGQSTKGKLQLQFADGNGGAYRMTLPTEAMVKMLPDGWTAEHLTVGTGYTVNFRIHWKEAGQYKNIFQIDQL